MKLKEIIEQIRTGRGTMEFIPTGFPKLDKVLFGGFLRQELVVIGGFTGIGKSSLAAQIFWNVAKRGFKSAYFSLEISNKLIVSRLIGLLADIHPIRVMSGGFSEQERKNWSNAIAELSVHDDFMDFSDDQYELEALKKQITENGYEFVVIDFIQNVFSSGDKEYERLSRVALELQKLAKEADCCILVLSQLSNQMARDGSKTTIFEYKGSGSIATVCDLGFFIEKIKENGVEIPNQILLTLKKNRRGVSGQSLSLKYKYPSGELTENDT